MLGEYRAGEFALRDVEGREAAISMVGWRLLRPFRVLVDYPGRRIVLATGRTLPPDVHTETWVRVPFRASGSGIVTDATVDGRAPSYRYLDLHGHRLDLFGSREPERPRGFQVEMQAARDALDRHGRTPSVGMAPGHAGDARDDSTVTFAIKDHRELRDVLPVLHGDIVTSQPWN